MNSQASSSQVQGTGSRGTRIVGSIALALTAMLLLFGLVLSPPEIAQGESVRLFYLHVPSAIVSLYIAFAITLVGSIIHLRNGSVFWDLVAGASAEVGVLFLGFTLVTGMLWGRPTWGTYWTWDPRLTSTAVSFILYLGYLAVRRLDMDPVARSRRAAVLGIISFFNVIIVRFSVQIWRSLHQGTTIDPTDTQMDNIMLFSFFLGMVAMVSIFAWLLMHRFRLAWIEHQLDEDRLAGAIAARRSEAGEADASGLNPGAI